MLNTDFNFYGTCLTLSFISCAVITWKNCQKRQFEPNHILYLLLYEVIGALLGGKYYTYFASYPKYVGHSFLEIGLSSCGSFIGMVLLFFIYSRQFGKKFTEILALVIPAVPLMYGIGKIGCFFAGCCLGFEYEGIGAIYYRYNELLNSDVSHFPIQILESIVFIILAVYFLKKSSKRDSPLECLIACGIAKFLLEFLRLEHVGKILTINQWICLILIVISGIVYANFKREVDS